MYELNGKVAIVTGGASGIGLATAEAFLKKGMKVVVSDYNKETGEKAVASLTSLGDVIFIFADVSKEEDVKQLVSKTVDHFGRLDVLFNNAGVGALTDTVSLSYEDYFKVIAINQNSIFFGAKYGVPEMRKVGGGAIINTSSILGLVGQAGAFAYNASKGAVNNMTKSLALEFATDKIRVNSVNPGYTESGMVSKEALGDYYDGLVAQHPIGRLGVANDIAHGVVFLAENEFTTGHNLYIDGGYTAK
jgi:NAD(P)-dependent dehydrogenase (short-subunit alcohol dehydrogenase family)